MANGSWTHGLKGLASVKNFIALQSTVEVALDGSCNSEYASGRYISGPGGAPDFAFGASVATGGRSILAMPSTAAKGKISRIVTNFQPGAPTTLPSYTTDIVVTEFGAVELRGKTLRERAELLVSIAHPDFHHALTI
jgi:4-hydroxybutyrate CoA-transferase